MGPVRSLRRNTSPLTILIGFALCLFILFFLFSPSGVDSALQQSREDKAASNPLSPPTQAFRKSTAKGNGKRVPPPVIHYHLNNVTTTSDPIGKPGNHPHPDSSCSILPTVLGQPSCAHLPTRSNHIGLHNTKEQGRKRSLHTATRTDFKDPKGPREEAIRKHNRGTSRFRSTTIFSG